MKRYVPVCLLLSVFVALLALYARADSSYATKVYNAQGGNELVVADGGAITVQSGGRINVFTPRGTLRFADSTVTTGGVGTSWATAHKTLTAAVAACTAGDTILARGSFVESVTLGTASITIAGAGTSPRDACYWNPVAGDDKVNLAITAAYCRVENLYLRPGPQSAGVSACISLGTGASYTQIRRCRLQGSTGAYYGIYSAAVGADNVQIVGNEFMYFNTATEGAAIRGVNAGGVQYSGWHIRDNVFSSCVTDIKLSGRACTITGNVMPAGGITAAGATSATVTTLAIDLSGDSATNSGANIVTRNSFGGTYGTTAYKVGATGDMWVGNFAGIDAQTCTAGVTVLVPD